MKFKFVLRSLFLITILFSCALADCTAQEAIKEDTVKKPKSKFKEYSVLIPDTAITTSGVFKSHDVDGKLYYEIPGNKMGKEFLWITQYSKTQTSFGYGGTEVIRRVVRWERLKDNILLRNVEYQLRADEGTPEEIAVKASSVENIIQSFKIEAFNGSLTSAFASFFSSLHLRI